MKVELTKAQCETLLDYIEMNLLDVIRNDTDIDNIEWLQNMMDARRELQRVCKEDGGNHDE